jgi:hypothetical protein
VGLTSSSRLAIARPSVIDAASHAERHRPQAFFEDQAIRDATGFIIA